MVLMHIISPAAGRMRPKTRSAGICRTNRSRPVSVSRLTRMLVPKPKKAFQSPGTQSAGLAPRREDGDLRAVMAGAPDTLDGWGRTLGRCLVPQHCRAVDVVVAEGAPP